MLLTGCKSRIAKTEHIVQVPYSVDELEHRTFNFFWELADPVTYQIPDRYPTLTFSSIAATGFGLSAYSIGVERKYVTREQAATRTLRTLQALWQLRQGPDKADISGYHGFFYHFLTLDKSSRYHEVELSSIDTGLLMAGILSSMSYFDQHNRVEDSIRLTSDNLYRRVEWSWMMNDSLQLSMGWSPEHGFIPNQWKGYNEAMILLIMGIGSPTHPLPAEVWTQWCSTYTWNKYEGQ